MQSQFMPDIDANPTLTTTTVSPIQTTYTTMPTTVTNTFTTQNLGSAVEFGDYKTTTNVAEYIYNTKSWCLRSIWRI